MYWHVLFMLVVLVICFVALVFFFFNATATTEIYTLSLHDALPISGKRSRPGRPRTRPGARRRLATSGTPRPAGGHPRSEEHTSELQSQFHLVCRLLLEKKKKKQKQKKHLQYPIYNTTTITTHFNTE